MSENPSNSVELQNKLSEMIDDALKDFDDSGETTEQSTIPEVHTSIADDFVKECSSSDQAKLAPSLQQIILDGGELDLQTVIQESLKNLSEAKVNLHERNDMASMFANMAIQNDINSDKDLFPMIMKYCMQPLLNKEILYPLIKNVCDKYSKWLEDNELTSDKEEFNKYARIFDILKEVKGNLENQQDTDDEITKTRKFKELLELLKKMQ